MKAQDTSELFFDEVRVPAGQPAGRPGEGQGFIQLMQQLPQERLIIAVQGVARWSARWSRDAGLRQGAQGLRQDGVGLPEHQFKLAEVQASCWRRAPSSTPAWWRT
jgi:acyl-CoA dehydrogenase